jgi:hypothetical protein
LNYQINTALINKLIEKKASLEKLIKNYKINLNLNLKLQDGKTSKLVAGTGSASGVTSLITHSNNKHS